MQKNKDGYSIKITVLIWYTGRDSNPQPSEPESDALSIEPPVHRFNSLNIIARFPGFVKRQFAKFYFSPDNLLKNSCFPDKVVL